MEYQYSYTYGAIIMERDWPIDGRSNDAKLLLHGLNIKY